jgi:RNA polymerase sigma-70 factor (ECF subfamily)
VSNNPAQPDEVELIRKAQSGSIVAFETLVKKYDKQVLQLACSLVNNTQDAEDVYQEVFVRVYKNLRLFKFRSQFSTWLYRVVVNYCMNHNRKNKRVKRFSLNGAQDDQGDLWKMTLKGQELDPEDAMLNTELSQEIDAALQQLSEQQKTVFVLRHYHGHKLKDIARIMRCSEGTVKNYLFRATQKLQRLLYAYYAQS